MTLLINILFSLNLIIPQHTPQDTTQHVQPAPKALQELLEKLTKEEKTKNDVDLEIDGLLVDDTKTKIGRDFYDLFYSKWQAPEQAKNYTITIQEKPFRLTSTLIVVLINDHVVYQSILQPRQNIVEDLAQQAIGYTYNYLQNYEEIMQQLNGEDQEGTGIF